MAAVRNISPFLLVSAALATAPIGASAAEPPQLRGEITARYAAELDDGDAQIAELLYEPELTGRLNANLSYTVIGRVRYDAVDELEPGDPGAQANGRSSWNRRVFWGDDADLELREAYIDAYAGSWFVRLGKQQVVWGQSDGLRVLDQINPLSFREFILGDFEDRRIPTWMLNAERVGAVTVQILWIPDTTYDEVPRDGAFAFTSSRFGPQIPTDATTVSFNEGRRPDNAITDSDVGLRLSGLLGGWDWSVNALYAYRDQPVFRRSDVAATQYAFEPEFERSALFGASASNAFGKFTLRTEIGHQTDAFIATASPAASDGVLETSETSGVVGLDYQHDADTLLSGQIFVSQIADEVELAAREQTTSTGSLLASREMRNDLLKLEALLLHDFDEGDGLLQISARYNLTDAITARVGVDLFYGDADGLYGQFDERDRATFALTYGF